MSEQDTLQQRVASQLTRDVHPAIADFAERLAREAGAQAVLFYGSNLRTGELEGVLDYYVLLPGPQEEKIWPRVSYHEWEHAGEVLRAKVATMALETFTKAAMGRSRDTTIWARFVQPSALVWAADDDARDAVTDAICWAARTAARLAAVLGPERGTEEDYWKALFQATYKAEFRVEKPGRENSIIDANRAHFDGLFPLALAADGQAFSREDELFVPHVAADTANWVRSWWKVRQRSGKPLNVLRLFKATTTFDGAARYAAWKIERHTGVSVEVTPWKEKHPVLAAPGVLWKVWRSRR